MKREDEDVSAQCVKREDENVDNEEESGLAYVFRVAEQKLKQAEEKESLSIARIEYTEQWLESAQEEHRKEALEMDRLRQNVKVLKRLMEN
jgi:hypothetical protein